MFDYKVAVMTGTGQGIGAGCAREMAKSGYKVSLMSPPNRSIELAKELGGIGRSRYALPYTVFPNCTEIATLDTTFA